MSIDIHPDASRPVRALSGKKALEHRLEQTLFASRWLMAPMYLGLALALAMVCILFLRELADSVPLFMNASSDRGILVILSLIDLTLAGNLLLIVLFSGYENFVSKFDIDDGGDRPDWMGTVNFTGLKMKLIASIVAISAIHLLKRFMELGGEDAGAVPERELMWLTIIHLTFVVSGVPARDDGQALLGHGQALRRAGGRAGIAPRGARCGGRAGWRGARKCRWP